MTYSIVARDRDSGDLGVAVQSHWFSVGSVVPWARPGVGAVATQANAEVAYGPRALALLEGGASAADALAALLAEDSAAATRQVAVLDARGAVAVHTGERCIPFAGHAVADGIGCQANLMRSSEVWPAMLAAFESTGGSFTGRLLAALDAAEAAGGDIRGRQSAAILVVGAGAQAWETSVSLRVEDHPEPLVELRRLVGVHTAYVVAAEGDRLLGDGELDAAATQYRRASELAPDNDELLFWSGLGAVHSGQLELGAAQLREAIARHAGWAELLARLSDESAPGARAARTLLAAELPAPPGS
ncbi:MAG: DUF1028 domain-containing protein [Solirubrobacteraceae bacterium]|jgi:uncharacterized Ntn-hydrolase superfamily protein